MKKKLVIAMVAFSIIGGGVAGAEVYHISDAYSQAHDNIDKAFSDYQKQKQDMLKNDTDALTQEEIKRLNDEVMTYFKQEKGRDYQNSLNQKSDAIKAKTNQSIADLKKYIDSLFKTKGGEPKG
jgi:uncharacterized membrane protein YgaE (UPF0421/DUF939 family)